MKKFTAMLMALTMAALTLTGCSSEEGSSSVTEQNVETFVTTSITEEVKEEMTEEDNSIILADTREELVIGLLEAILAEDKDKVMKYNFSSKSYTKIQESLSDSKIKAGLSKNDALTSEDFEIYLTGPNKSSVNSTTDKVFVYIISPKLTMLEIGAFVIEYDFDTEKYMFSYSKGEGSVSHSYSADDEYLTDYGYSNYYDRIIGSFKNAQLV